MFWSRFWSILLLVIYLTSFMSGGYLFDDMLDTCKRIKIRLNKNPYLHNIPQQDFSVLSYRIVCIHCHLDCILVAEHYLQIFTVFNKYLQLFTIIYNYLHLFTIIYNYSQFSLTSTTFWPQNIIYNWNHFSCFSSAHDDRPIPIAFTRTF